MSSNPIPVPLLDLRKQYGQIRDEVLSEMGKILDSQLFILGPQVQALEEEIAQYSTCQKAVGVTSGTDALLIALMALGIEPGDEVITTAYSFFATAGSIVRLGARPVFVDIDPQTFNIDPGAIASAVTERTRVILPVHLFGQMADMKSIMEIAGAKNLAVIEDAAQAIGAEADGYRAGSVGELGCFSFFPSKNLGAFGDGGMVTTNSTSLYDELTLLRNHGYRPKYFNKRVGGNFRLDALQAAVLRVKLKYLDSWTRKRQENAALYRRLFAEAGLVTETNPDGEITERNRLGLPYERDDSRHIYNQFVVSVHSDRRSALIEYLRQQEIGCEIYYPVPLHLQECLSGLGHQPGDLPASETAADQTLAIPIFPELLESQIETVVTAIGDFFDSPAGPDPK